MPFKEAAFLKFFDLVAPSVALAQGFGRIGCLLAGCCYGRETEGALAITFQNSSFAPNHVALIPTQVYSSLSDFLHFGILIWIARHKKADGQVAACYLIFTVSGGLSWNFFVEIWRGGSVGGFPPPSLSGFSRGLQGFGCFCMQEKKG